MYKNIQLLRALSSIYVVFFHGALLIGLAIPNMHWISKIISRGYIGVDVFFVISGLVAALTLSRAELSGLSATEYFFRRISRIYLGYWPFYFLSLILAWYFSPALLSQWEILKSFFLIFFVGHDNGKNLVLYVAWSLTYEVIFYFLAAISINHIKEKGQKNIAIAVVISTSILILWSGAKDNPFSIFLSFFCEFLFGFVAYFTAIKYKSHPKIKLLSALALSILSLTLGCIIDVNLGPIRALTFGLFAFGIVVCMLLLESNYKIVSKNIFVAIGDASYSLYLCHTVFFSIFEYSGLTFAIQNFSENLRFIAVFIIFSGMIIFSLAYYRLIEKPVYKIAIDNFPWKNSKST
jgi:peptidoglycan/LPS O-acetylase OafA/YrhL